MAWVYKDGVCLLPVRPKSPSVSYIHIFYFDFSEGSLKTLKRKNNSHSLTLGATFMFVYKFWFVRVVGVYGSHSEPPSNYFQRRLFNRIMCQKLDRTGSWFNDSVFRGI